MKKFIIVTVAILNLVYFPLLSNADTIYFKNGTRLDVEKVWEENDQVNPNVA